MDRIKNNKWLMVALALAMAIGLIIAPLRGSYADAYANAPVSVTVDGVLVLFADQRPIMVDNRVLVPVRGVFEHMGFEVTWDEEMRIARLERSDILIIIPADLTSFVANTAIISPSVPQRLVNHRLMLPLRYVAEAAFGTAEWDPVNRVAMITTNRHAQATPTPTPLPPTPQPPTPPPEETPTPPPADPTPTPEPYDPTPTPTPEPYDPTPTPTPEPTPSPTPPPPTPRALIYGPMDEFNATHPRQNMIRAGNINVQGTVHSGNILTRGAQRESYSWIDFDISESDYTRLTGYVGRTGVAHPVPNAASRRVTIYGDGQRLGYFDVDGNSVAAPFDVSITGVNILRVHFQAIGPVDENGVSLTVFDLIVR